MSDFITYKKQFIEEALDLLERAGDNILKAEANSSDTDLLNSIFRDIHTIKGSAGSFDMDNISKFAHSLENMLGKIRDGLIILDSSKVDIILTSCDKLTDMVKSYKNGSIPEIDNVLIEKINLIISKIEIKEEKKVNQTIAKTIKNQTYNLPIISIDQIDNIRKLMNNKTGFFEIKIHYPDDAFEHGYDPAVLLNNIKKKSIYYFVVSSYNTIPIFFEFNPYKFFLTPVIYIISELNIDELVDLSIDADYLTVLDISSSLNLKSEKSENLIILDNMDNEQIKEFVVSTLEQFESAEEQILQFEKSRSVETINKLFRIIHTIKGDSAYIGIAELTKVMHNVESLLEGIKSGTIENSIITTDYILKAVDETKKIINKIDKNERKINIPKIFNDIEHFLKKPQNREVELQNEDYTKFIQQSDSSRKIFLDQLTQFQEILKLILIKDFDEDNKRNIKRFLASLKNSSNFIGVSGLTNLCSKALQDINDNINLKNHIEEILSFIEGLVEEPKKLGEILIEGSKINKEDLEDALSKQKTVGEILIESGKVNEEDIEQALKKQKLMKVASLLKTEATSDKQEIKTMRINEEKLEEFSNMIGELVIAKNTYEFIINALGLRKDIDVYVVKILKENYQIFSRVSNELQTSVMSIKMVPIAGIFKKFDRVVRDISRTQGKKIDLITVGDDTEIDKKIADILSEPLIHMIRNSCDHGIEMPDDRQKAGKPESGTVTLKAGYEGRNLLLSITDDGKGIDRKKLYEKVKKMGMSVTGVDDPALLEMIFLPGVSTKAEVSDLSGRGVGMDVVQSTIRSMGGSVKFDSKDGKGTEFTFSIPLKMGISSSLLFTSGKNKYAIPLEYILGTLKVAPSKIFSIRDRMVINYRDEVIPVEFLNTLLSPEDTSVNTKKDENAIIILNTAGGKYGIIVDNFERNLEIAIKPVPAQLAYLKFISGVSIMGDGEVILVINPVDLI